MNMYLLIALFIICNSLSAFYTYLLWAVNAPIGSLSSNGLAGGAVIMAILIFGVVGNFIGGLLTSKKIYKEKGKRTFFTVLCPSLFVGLFFVVKSVPDQSVVLFPPMGIIFLYLVMSTTWMLIEISRKAV